MDVTKKMDWWKARQTGKRTTSVTDENDRRKGDRAARWLDKVDGKKAKPSKRR